MSSQRSLVIPIGSLCCRYTASSKLFTPSEKGTVVLSPKSRMTGWPIKGLPLFPNPNFRRPRLVRVPSSHPRYYSPFRLPHADPGWKIATVSPADKREAPLSSTCRVASIVPKHIYVRANKHPQQRRLRRWESILSGAHKSFCKGSCPCARRVSDIFLPPLSARLILHTLRRSVRCGPLQIFLRSNISNTAAA